MERTDIKEEKYCYQIIFDKEWGMPLIIYVIAEDMGKACEYAETHKNWQQEIASCKLMGLAP